MRPAVPGSAALSALWTYRYQLLAWLGVVGTAMTLFVGLKELLAGLQILATWVRLGMEYWAWLTRIPWELLLGWLFQWFAITVPDWLVTFLNFAFFGLVLAVGLRLRKSYVSAEDLASEPVPRVAYWRIAGAFLLATTIPFITLALGVATLDQNLQRFDYVLLAYAFLALVTMALGFCWTHRFAWHAVQVFPFALLYSAVTCVIPLLRITPEDVERLVRYGWYLPSLEENFLAVFATPGVIISVVSIMLAIAPALALRAKLVSSIKLSLALLAGNLLFVGAEYAVDYVTGLVDDVWWEIERIFDGIWWRIRRFNIDIWWT